MCVEQNVMREEDEVGTRVINNEDVTKVLTQARRMLLISGKVHNGG